jgi:N-acyl amino acid synthase of PEP-CTERM/exosortase system
MSTRRMQQSSFAEQKGKMAAARQIRGVASPPVSSPADTPLLARFHYWFDVISADTPELIEIAHRLRYQVYCVENPWEDPSRNPDGLERDEYDARAAHSLLVHRPSGSAVGTVRVILPDPNALSNSFPAQRICTDPRLTDPTVLPLASMGEISRFSISREFRRRPGDTVRGELGPMFPVDPKEERRMSPHMKLGLMQGLVRSSVEYGLTHWCAAMEPWLIRMLESMAIYFEPLGPPVDFHGMRQPCFGSIRSILERIREEKPEIWPVITDDGRLWQMVEKRSGA